MEKDELHPIDQLFDPLAPESETDNAFPNCFELASNLDKYRKLKLKGKLSDDKKTKEEEFYEMFFDMEIFENIYCGKGNASKIATCFMTFYKQGFFNHLDLKNDYDYAELHNTDEKISLYDFLKLFLSDEDQKLLKINSHN